MVVLVEETGSLGLWFTVSFVLDDSFVWPIVNVFAYTGRRPGAFSGGHLLVEVVRGL